MPVRSSRLRSSRQALALGAIALIASVTLAACGGGAGSGGAGGGGDSGGTGDAAGAAGPVAIPANFPADLVPILDGTVTSVTYDAVNSTSPTQKWSVYVTPDSGGASEAVALLEGAGWELDADNHQLADGSDNWLFSGDYALVIIESSGPPASVSYALRLDGTSEISLPDDFPASLPIPDGTLSELNYSANSSQTSWVFTLQPDTADLAAAAELATGAGWEVGGNTGYEYSLVNGDYSLGLGPRNSGDSTAVPPLFYFLTYLAG